MERDDRTAEKVQVDVKLGEFGERIRQASTRDELIVFVTDALEALGILEVGIDLSPVNEKLPHIYIISVRGALYNLNIPVPPPPPAPLNTPRDADYYSNVEYLRYDLAKFARAQKKDVCELRVQRNESILCANHEVIKWQTYLLNAGVALGMAGKMIEAARIKALILITLFQKAGYEVEYKFYKAKHRNVAEGEKPPLTHFLELPEERQRADRYVIIKVSLPGE